MTVSINDNIKLLENIKQGFTKGISWNKYRPEITIQTKNNNLGYLADSTFRNINRLFGFSFKNKVMMILQEILLINVTCH